MDQFAEQPIVFVLTITNVINFIAALSQEQGQGEEGSATLPIIASYYC